MIFLFENIMFKGKLKYIMIPVQPVPLKVVLMKSNGLSPPFYFPPEGDFQRIEKEKEEGMIEILFKTMFHYFGNFF